MSTETLEPPAQTADLSVGGSKKGDSALFKAVIANQAQRPSEPAATPPSPTPEAKKAIPEVVVTPAKEEKKEQQAEAPIVNPLDLLKEPEGEKKEVSQLTDTDAELAAFEKELPVAYEGMGAKPKESWDKMRESSKRAKSEAITAKREAESLKAEIAKLREVPVTPMAPEEFESIKRENMTLKQKNAVWALETDPKFVQGVLRPLDEAGAALGSLMDTYKISTSELDKAFSEKDRSARNKAFSEIILEKEMNPLDVEDFKKAVQTVTDLSFKRDEGYANATKLNEAAALLAKEEQVKTQEMTKAQISEEEGKVWDKISKNAPVIKDILGDSKVSSDVRAKVKEFLSTDQTHEMKVFAAYASYLLPHIPGLVKAKDTEIASLKQALKDKLDGDATTGSGHKPSTPPAQETGDYKPGSAVGAAVDTWRRATGRV